MKYPHDTFSFVFVVLNIDQIIAQSPRKNINPINIFLANGIKNAHMKAVINSKIAVKISESSTIVCIVSP